MKTVGIIGGSGFIGSHITKKFLSGNYRVRVSATDITRKEKYAHLHNLQQSENLELFPLDVQDMDALKKFEAGCDILVHGGTPFQLDVQDPKTELFDPTIKGTENFLQVVSESPTVKKVVFIASVAAHNTDFPLPPKGLEVGQVVSENDKPYFSEESHPYAQAKFLANQAVQDFVDKNPNPGFDIATVSPVWVVGNPLSAREDSTSVGMQFLFKNKIAPNPFVQMFYDTDVLFAMVDVDDVAQAVFNAATSSGLHGKRYLLTSESYPVSDISLMLNGKEPARQPQTVYSNGLATLDLGVHFKPARIPLSQYAKATEG